MSRTQFSTIDQAIQAIALGKMVIVLDDEDRENEGDFICAAEKVTPQGINFLLKHGKGRICVSILPEVAKRLDLPLMVQHQPDSFRTAFTITVDHVSSKTGITASERARTIEALIDPKTTIPDLVRPGHIDPLIAKEGGVLRRAGHTEAAVDLARLAGLDPSGVLCEILDDEGDRATRPQLMEMAEHFDLPIITIEELIKYRQTRERLISRVAEAKLPTSYGDFKIIAYEVKYESTQPIVLVMEISMPLRRHWSGCTAHALPATCSSRCDATAVTSCTWLCG